MYELTVKGNLLKATYETLAQAMTGAIALFESGYECDVVNMLTGEIMIALNKDRYPYVAESIHEII